MLVGLQRVIVRPQHEKRIECTAFVPWVVKHEAVGERLSGEVEADLFHRDELVVVLQVAANPDVAEQRGVKLRLDHKLAANHDLGCHECRAVVDLVIGVRAALKIEKEELDPQCVEATLTRASPWIVEARRIVRNHLHQYCWLVVLIKTLPGKSKLVAQRGSGQLASPSRQRTDLHDNGAGATHLSALSDHFRT
ncbi:hypothetical protein KRP22_006495 [Phytophthora ramorum]|nr:hypothetical protein KRP22_2375 [Phytophthora ramorum]